MILQEVVVNTNLRYFSRISRSAFSRDFPHSLAHFSSSVGQPGRQQEENSAPVCRGMRWASCESCGKWRIIPEDVVLGAVFRCKDNYWDELHASCEAEEEKEEGEEGSWVMETISDRAEMFGSELGNVTHRFRLTRQWNLALKEVVYVMHNPSTATDCLLDSTMRRCRDFAADNGFGSFHVVNLFAMRSKDPTLLRKHANHDLDTVIGNPLNDETIRATILRPNVGAVCLAWGALASSKTLQARADQVLELVHQCSSSNKNKLVCCLQINALGAPKHPLYIRKGIKFMEYRKDAVAIQAVILKRKHRAKQLHDADQTLSAVKKKKKKHSTTDEGNQQESLSSIAIDLSTTLEIKK